MSATISQQASTAMGVNSLLLVFCVLLGLVTAKELFAIMGVKTPWLARFLVLLLAMLDDLSNVTAQRLTQDCFVIASHTFRYATTMYQSSGSISRSLTTFVTPSKKTA